MAREAAGRAAGGETGDLVGTIPLSPDEELRVYLLEEDGQRALSLQRYRRSRWGEGYAEAGEALLVPLEAVPRLQASLADVDAALDARGWTPPSPAPPERLAAPFAHASEEELARILDFYRIEWQYEPKTFPLEWGEDGRVVESFTPDFYLPQFDLFIELTTLKQDLVTKKNRKIRRLRELYPEVNLKIFYGRDYRSLLRRFGITREEGKKGVSPK
ncbi:MAG: hypothetical protein L0214_03325 [candidate division NC10 bacterium]|nr:hypothetical protein [candidate division NC10 bacterium]